LLRATVRGTERDMAVLDCGGTTVWALAQSALLAGEAVTVAVRPERLRFADQMDTPAENRMPVTIGEWVFAGDCHRYLCQADAGMSLVLKQASGSTIRRRRSGERADLVWSASDCIII
jgi:ABC-type Fe3+/spermidine/putrescine transport system ATPase subunit